MRQYDADMAVWARQCASYYGQDYYTFQAIRLVIATPDAPEPEYGRADWTYKTVGWYPETKYGGSIVAAREVAFRDFADEWFRPGRRRVFLYQHGVGMSTGEVLRYAEK
jgi:hypothetical protein